MKLNGGQALIKALEMEGVEVIFGLPGGAILPVYDPIIDSPIRHILVRHEQGAGHMAEGYAHATGRPGVAMVTSGPAATNIVTPLCDAYMDSIPMVVITGQVPHAGDRHRRVPGVRHRRHHPVGHQAQRARHRGAGHPADRSARRSTSRRPGRPGPVLVDIPKDIVDPKNPRSAMEWYWPTDDEVATACPATSRTTKGRSRARSSEAAELILQVDAPGDLRRRRHPQGARRRGAARAGRADRHPRRHHADGPGRVPRRPSAVPRHAGHARQLHRGHVDAGERPAHRARHPLRRPRHRQGADVRARRQDHPRRHRPGRAGQGAPARRRRSSATAASSSRSWSRRSRELGGADAAARPQRVESRDLAAGRRTSRSPTSRAEPGDQLKPQYVLEQLRDNTPDDMHRRRRASASTRCGRASTGSSTTRTRG